ncbi:eukaryotic translation initiation factor 4 gamma 1 isoform X2 [Lepeophtheirus salmonis]|nr:eukaryotic translation initiation factor 4 gamma 1-like isoform X2 [Lepeophtheirus salmonis]
MGKYIASQQYAPYNVFTSPVVQPPMVSRVNSARFSYSQPYQYCINTMYSDQPMFNSTNVPIHQPMVSTQFPSSGIPMSQTECMQPMFSTLGPAPTHSPHMNRAREPSTKKKSRAIEIVDPETMKAINLDKDHCSKSMPSKAECQDSKPTLSEVHSQKEEKLETLSSETSVVKPINVKLENCTTEDDVTNENILSQPSIIDQISSESVEASGEVDDLVKGNLTSDEALVRTNTLNNSNEPEQVEGHIASNDEESVSKVVCYDSVTPSCLSIQGVCSNERELEVDNNSSESSAHVSPIDDFSNDNNNGDSALSDKSIFGPRGSSLLVTSAFPSTEYVNDKSLELKESEGVIGNQSSTHQCIESDGSTDSIGKSKENDALNGLKYDYKPGQWSPVNLDGKRQYDRQFLMQLQRNPVSLTKPENLPELDIIKSVANESHSNKYSDKVKDQPDFMPIFSERSSIVKSTSRNSVPKRSSRDGRSGRGGGSSSINASNNFNSSAVRSINNSMHEMVKLRKADNPWRPSNNKTEIVEVCDDSMEDLGKKIRSILNKLTPQKFDDLVQKFNELTIDSEAKLTHAIELIFEKAIDEPNYSVAYARMCEVLQQKNVNNAKFKPMIISKCQNEFEKAYMSPEEKKKYLEDLSAAKSETDKKAIKEDFAMRELRARRRSLGNIRFIGEIFKRGLLTIQIMHGCINELLTSHDDESLESLCRLLTTVGKKVENETKLSLNSGKSVDQRVRSMEKYFQYIQDLIEGRPFGIKNPGEMTVSRDPISNRIRFMLLDVVDLRKRDWVPRRDVAGPKTIDQIHRDMAREKQANALNTINTNTSRHEGSRNTSRNSNMMSNSSKRSFRNGSFTNGQNSGNSDDGNWSTVKMKSEAKNEAIDMDLMKNAHSNKMSNMEGIKLGPRHMWGKGSGSRCARGSQSSDLGVKNHNRFGSLSNDSESTRDTGSGSKSTSSKDIRVSGTDLEKELSLNKSKDGGNVSRLTESSVTIHVKCKLNGPSDLTGDLLESEASSIFNTYIRNYNLEEAIISVQRRMHSNNIKNMVEYLIDKELDSSSGRRISLSLFIETLMKKNFLPRFEMESVISYFYKGAQDYLSDFPRFWEYFVETIVNLFRPTYEPTLQTSELPMSYAIDFINSDNNNKGFEFIANLIIALVSQIGEARTFELFHSSQLHLKDSSLIDRFVSSNEKLIFLKRPLGHSSPEAIKLKLESLLLSDASNDTMCNWINNTVGKDISQEKWFIRTVIMECTRSAIKMPEKQLNVSDLDARLPLFSKLLNTDFDKQLQALFAIQKLVSELSFPPALFVNLFSKLSEAEVIKDDAFLAWKKDDSSAERDGKGVCMTSLTRFFQAIEN